MVDTIYQKHFSKLTELELKYIRLCKNNNSFLNWLYSLLFDTYIYLFEDGNIDSNEDIIFNAVISKLMNE